MAKNIREAMRKEKVTEMTEVYIDPDWLRMQDEQLKKPIGFKC